MYPELFELPFIHITVKTYGLIMVIGFLAAVYMIRKLVVKIGGNPELVSNAALYALLSGIVGARAFYVIHHFSEFRGEQWWAVFATWRGGLEFLGGVCLAIIVVVTYLIYKKLSVWRYIDVLVSALFSVCRSDV